MVRMTPVAAVVVAAVLNATPALSADGPFGIGPGVSIEELGGIDRGQSAYDLLTVPLPDPEFILYSVRAPQAFGVCAISVMSEIHSGDLTSSGVERARDRLIQHLTVRYGEPAAKYDQPLDSAIWYRPWVRSIENEDGEVGTVWSGTESRPLPDGVDVAILQVVGLDAHRFAFKVEFAFPSEAKCLGHIFNPTPWWGQAIPRTYDPSDAIQIVE